MWTNISTLIINHSFKTAGHGKVDIQTLRDTSPTNIKINWHKHHKSYIQSRLSETEGQTHLYIEHSKVIKAVLHELLRLPCNYYNCTYSWNFLLRSRGVLLKWQFKHQKLSDLNVTRDATKNLLNPTVNQWSFVFRFRCNSARCKYAKTFWLVIEVRRYHYWLIHGTKHRKDNQLQSLELPCRIS